MNIVIIGASSAIASAIAIKYAQQGHRIFAITRQPAAIAQLAEQLGEQFAGSYCFDFADQTERAGAAIAAAQSQLGSIDLALIAHGMLPDQIHTESDYPALEHCFAVNALSVLALVQALSQCMQQQGFGKLGVISSVAGDRGRPRNFSYGAAKSAVSTYLQGLRSSLYDSGVEVYDFRLGPVDTPMTIDHEKNFSFSSVDKVSELIIRHFQGRKYCCYVPGFWYWVMLAVRNMPEAIFQRLKFLSAR